MTSHGKALVLATEKALIVVGMPFGSYEQSPQMAFRRAAWIMKETGSGAIKLEGGLWMADTIRFLVQRGILLMAHIGLTPQSSHVMGGFKIQGREVDSWPKHEVDARAVCAAGDFALVLEGMVEGWHVKSPIILRPQQLGSAPLRPGMVRYWCWKICLV